MLNLDTHVLIFALRGELRVPERTLLARERWSVSAIVFWELAKLRQLGRIDLDLEDREVAAVLNRTATAVGPHHDALIRRGLCYSPRHGVIDFTVPMFDGFVRRALT